MLRIGVMSDSHLRYDRDGAARLQRLTSEHFASVDLIFHAGDLTDPDLLPLFDVPVYAVRGNLDPATPELPERRIVEVAGHRFGLIHGWGAAEGLELRVRRIFDGERLDCIVFGHSHRPYNRQHGELLLFNPGSCFDRRSAPRHTIGILEVADTITGQIISID